MHIVLTGPNFFGYKDSIANSIKSLGHTVEVHPYPNVINSWRRSLFKKLSSAKGGNWERDKLKYFKRDIEEYNGNLKSKKSRADCLFVLKGDLVPKQTIQTYNNADTTTILWAYDKASRFPLIEQSAPHYDYFYSFELSDVKYFKRRSIECDYLPMGYDSSIYNPINTTKKYDIVFVGHLYDSRKQIFNSLINEFGNDRVELWGKNYSSTSIKSLYNYHIKYPNIKHSLNNYNIEHEQVNEIYNSAKICVNIHHAQSDLSYNPRTLEILGSRGFQIVDYKPVIEKEFGRGLITYSTVDGLINKVHTYLNKPEERNHIANEGHDITHTDHSFQSRMEYIFSRLNT